MALLDTRSKPDDVTGTLIADLVLQILAYVAQKERDFIHHRQAEGTAVAKAKGIGFGRREKNMPEGFDEVCRAYMQGGMTIRKSADSIGINHSTFYRHCLKKYGNSSIL